MAPHPRVALLIETSRQYGRDLLRGVRRYQRERGPWSIYFEPHGFGEPPPRWLADWQGDGILARIVDRRLATAVLRKKLPAVDLRGAFTDLGLPYVDTDNRLVVRLAFEHLWERGFRHFGYCGVPRKQNVWVDDRMERFVRRVEKAGRRCHLFLGTLGQYKTAKMKDERPQIAKWMASLPKPIGILACNDDRGQQVLDACLQIGVQVPEEVAVIGVDNDEFLCELSNPRLTSIAMNLADVGYQAAAVLHGLMSGRRAGKKRLMIRGMRLVARDSTDVLAVEDPDTRTALEFIRQNAERLISVTEVAQAASVSRRVLERKFQRNLGRTPNEEIARVRLERARLLLIDTDLSLAVIAAKIGMGTASYFGYVFRRRFGVTPAEFRQRAARET